MHPAMRATALVAAAIPALMFAKPVSAQSIVGVWESSLPTRISNEGGTETPSNFVTVTMTIEQRGDSIFATSLRGPAEGLPPATSRTFKGTFRDGTATLVSPPTQAKMNRDGEESTIEMITTFVLKLQGDELVGSQSASSTDGSVESQSRDFKATRKKA